MTLGLGPGQDSTSERELLEMDKAGVRGIRLNNPAVTPESLRQAFSRVKSMRGWHVQINTKLAAIRELKPLILDASVPVVIDHVAGAVPEQGHTQAGFADLVELVGSGKAYVKITHNFMSNPTGNSVHKMRVNLI